MPHELAPILARCFVVPQQPSSAADSLASAEPTPDIGTSGASLRSQPLLTAQEEAKKRVKIWARQRHRGQMQEEKEAAVRRQRMSEFAELWKAHRKHQMSAPRNSAAVEQSKRPEKLVSNLLFWVNWLSKTTSHRM